MSYINEKCIYKILPKMDTNKAVKVDEKKLTPVLDNRIDKGRLTNQDDNQNWLFEYDEKYKAYKITNVKTKQIIGYCDEDNSSHIIMENSDLKTPYCRWIVEVTQDGYVILKNAGDAWDKKDRVLDIYGSNIRNGREIILHKPTGGDNQKFKLVRHKFIKEYKYPEAEKLKERHIQKENTYKNIEDLKYKLFSSEQFIKKWANIADMLGYKFCTGTNGVDIGEDFYVKKENGKYIIKANYRSKDPFAYEGNLSHRLEMEVSNIKLTFDPDSIKIGKPTITRLTPTVISTTNAVNHTSSESTATTELEYTVGNTISNSTSNSISNSIGVENSFKVKVHGMKFEQTFTYNITHDKTWGHQEDNSIETKIKATYSTPVPSGSNVPIYALLYQSKANIPYTAVANIEYNIRFSGYLKHDNALKDKSKQHGIVNYSFGKSNISATKFLENEYSTRDVHYNDSGWDYIWSILNYEPEYFNKYIGEAMTPDAVEISGIFTNIASTNVQIVGGRKEDKDTYKDIIQKGPIDSGIDEKDIRVEIEKIQKK